MKPFRLHGLRVAGLLLSLVCTVQATDTPLTATVLYDVKASCTGNVAPAVLAKAVPVTSTPCAESLTCDVTDVMFPATYCPTTDGTTGSSLDGDFYTTLLGSIFGDKPTVIVETYEGGESCDVTKLADINAYVADGQCHKTGSTSSYIAVSDKFGSAVKTFSAKSDCTGDSTTVAATLDELDANSCADNLLDMKMYRYGTTTVYLSSVVSYDTKDGDCQPLAVPTQVVSQVVAASCTSSLTCSGAGVPYTSTLCSTTTELEGFYQASYGTKQSLVFLREYAAGKSCAATDLTGLTAYLADKKCHKTDTLASFRATRSIDGAVTIKTYTTAADCTGTAATSVDWDVAQATGNTCVDGADGVVDTFVLGMGATPLYLTLTATFSKNTDKCTSPGIPILLKSATVDVDVCKSTDSCTTAGSFFTSIACSSTLSIQDDVAAIFGDTPFVIVEAFNAAKSCATAELDTITIYLADGECHKTGDTASYFATRTAAGDATVTTYTDALCSTGQEDLQLSPTANQAEVNSCKNDAGGILDKLVYGGGFTPLTLQSTALFESNSDSCVSPPAKATYLDTAVVDLNTCTASKDCTAAGELFTGTLCTSTTTYKDDTGAAFGSTPYVVVESYKAGANCATSSLKSTQTYAADAKCHATGADASFIATRRESGDMSITFYSDATCQEAIGDPLKVGASDAGSCIDDQIVYGVGESPTVLSTVLGFDDTDCEKVAQLIVTNELSCSASTECVATMGSGHFLQHSCSADPFDTAATMFGAAPYLVVELYKEDGCTTLDGVQVYSSDTNCHVAIDGTSFTSTLAETGAGDLVQYSDDKCEATGDDKTTTPLTAEMLGSGHPCTDKAKYYAFNGPPPPPPNETPSTPSTTTKTPSTTTKTPSTPTTTTATPSSTTEAPTTTSTGSGTSDASSLFTTSSTLTASLGLLAAAFGLVV
ncbi:hypothetical protein PR002_g1404 [Phytophthora rubi]|uniref:Uncharacterized protein n=1 Tax=Phytophthora rubi TaxID=129364 RepID=A0A6A3NU97_9STRA|nr:hypothetical protein PR002_g1404 [Phytophthora rubi]